MLTKEYEMLTHSKLSSSIIHEVQQGLPPSAAFELKALLGLSLPEISKLLCIPLSQLRNCNKQLPSDASERALYIAEIYRLILEIKGDARSASRWMRQPSIALDNHSPLYCCRFLLTIGLVREEISRLKYSHLA